MKHGKQLIILFISLFIALSPIAECYFCYAEDNIPGGGGGASGYAWTNVSTNEEIVGAFKAYCKIRNLTYTHVPNTVEAIVKWDYGNLQKLAALTDVDLEFLNAQMWYRIDQNDKLNWYFNSIALNELNKLYNAVINEDNIQENTDKNLYSGQSFQDSNGNIAFVYYGSTTSNTNNTFTKVGTYYLYTTRQIQQFTGSTITFPLRQQTVTYNVRDSTLQSSNITYIDHSQAYVYRNGGTNISTEFVEGGTILLRPANESPAYKNLYLCTLCKYKETISGITTLCNKTEQLVKINEPDLSPASIDVSQGEFNELPANKGVEVGTDDDSINNFITNNNTNITNNYYDDDEPPQPPNYTNPYNDNPTGTTIDPNGNINFQMPDLNIDWDLDIGDNPPFPFSIPFDIINFLNAFNTEPVTPHIEETITICNMDIDIDIDLEWLDDVAGYFRTFILLSYTIGLIVATRALFHIY